MPRRKVTIRRVKIADPKFGDMEAAKFINGIMFDGKKSTATRIFYDALDILKEKTNEDPLTVFKKSLANVKPRLEVRPRRVGGATYQVPQEVPSKRSTCRVPRQEGETDGRTPR
jgi:small subunit ribosomal protein S7